MKKLDPIHPGEILETEFMRPLGLSANALARQILVPVTRIWEIVSSRRGVTADTALRLARFFGTTPELWVGLQTEYDLRVASREIGSEIEKFIEPPRRTAAGRYEPVIRTESEIREREAPYGRKGSQRSARPAPKRRDKAMARLNPRKSP